MSKDVNTMPTIRRYPLPYRAMLAICSDIDQARIDTFREIHRFLNTEADTYLGRGLGLDIADSLWMYKGPNPNSYRDNLAYFDDHSWATPSPYAGELMEHARHGWIDTLHSYGNFNAVHGLDVRFTREHAERALEVLVESGVALRVWVNHGSPNNRQNIGNHPYMCGDRPDASEYHADLLRCFGTEFIWRHGGTSILGRPSALTVQRLHDQSEMFGFHRYHAPRVVGAAARVGMERQLKVNGELVQVWLPRALSCQLADPVLEELVSLGQFCVVGQHLGALPPLTGFDPEMAAPFKRLRQLQDDGRILVARTSRLLHFNRVRDYLNFTTSVRNGETIIDIETVVDPVRDRWIPSLEDLRGITFEIDPTPSAVLRLQGRLVDRREIVTEGGPGAITAIGMRWFEPDTTDYAAPFLAERSSYLLWSQAAREHAGGENDKALSFLANELEESGRHRNRQRYRSAVTRALCDYRQGLPHAISALERIGFTELGQGLEIGNCTGRWSFAYLAHNERVVGIDRSPEKVELATRLAGHLGYAGRARFVAGNAEELNFPEASFDCAWSVLELMSANVEPAVARISRSLARSGSLYLACAGEGARLSALEIGLPRANKRAVSRQLTALLDGYLHRCGIGRTREPIGMLDPPDILRVCRVFGLFYVGQPGLLEKPKEYLGYPAIFEFVVRKEQAHDKVRALLLDRQAVETIWAEDLEIIANSGCPGLVCDTIATTDPSLGEPQLRELYARALVRSGRAAENRKLFEDGSLLPDDVLGLYWQDCGNLDRAVLHYARLPDAHPDKAFLIGQCLLERGAWADARQVFQRTVGTGAREAVGLVAAQFHGGDRRGAVASFARFIDARSQLRPADPPPGPSGAPTPPVPAGISQKGTPDAIPLYKLAIDRAAFDQCSASERKDAVRFVDRLRQDGYLLPQGRPDKECAFIDLDRHHSFTAYLSKCKRVAETSLSRGYLNMGKTYFSEFFHYKTFLPDIVAINSSAAERDGRPVPAHYFLPVEGLGGFPRSAESEKPPANSFAWMRHFGLFRHKPGHSQGEVIVDRELLAYIRLRRCGEFAFYTTMIEHATHLDRGVVENMHLRLVKYLLKNRRSVTAPTTDQSIHGLRYIFCGRYFNQTESARLFMERMLFSPGLFQMELPTNASEAS